jgi:hypothetical protein
MLDTDCSALTSETRCSFRNTRYAMRITRKGDRTLERSRPLGMIDQSPSYISAALVMNARPVMIRQNLSEFQLTLQFTFAEPCMYSKRRVSAVPEMMRRFETEPICKKFMYGSTPTKLVGLSSTCFYNSIRPVCPWVPVRAQAFANNAHDAVSTSFYPPIAV